MFTNRRLQLFFSTLTFSVGFFLTLGLLSIVYVMCVWVCVCVCVCIYGQPKHKFYWSFGLFFNTIGFVAFFCYMFNWVLFVSIFFSVNIAYMEYLIEWSARPKWIDKKRSSCTCLCVCVVECEWVRVCVWRERTIHQSSKKIFKDNLTHKWGNKIHTNNWRVQNGRTMCKLNETPK